MHKSCVKHLRELNIDLPVAFAFTEIPGKLFALKISITFWGNKRQNFSHILWLILDTLEHFKGKNQRGVVCLNLWHFAELVRISWTKNKITSASS
jgi:hypothetical protein